jgi:hypothetical protein
MAHESKIRVLGVVSAEFSNGVSGLGRAIGELSAHAGVATLLLDLSLRAIDPVKGGWMPQSAHGMLQWTVRDTAGDLASYDLIVVTLPPIADLPDDAINPIVFGVPVTTERAGRARKRRKKQESRNAQAER